MKTISNYISMLGIVFVCHDPATKEIIPVPERFKEIEAIVAKNHVYGVPGFQWYGPNERGTMVECKEETDKEQPEERAQ